MAVVIALVAVIGCDGDSGSSNPTPPDLGTGNQERWYGVILIDEVFELQFSDSSPAGSQSSLYRNVYNTSLRVAPEGTRTATTDADSFTFVEDRSDQNDCKYVGSNRIEGSTEGFIRPFPETGYFNVVVDADGNYRIDEPASTIEVPGGGEATARTDISGCEGAYSTETTSVSPGLASVNLPFDKVTGKVDASGRLALGSADFVDERFPQSRFSMEWVLKREKDVVAVAGGPYTVPRADKVKLDGSKSRGDIEKYTWTLTPAGECKSMGTANAGAIEIGKSVTREGKTTEFGVLCRTRAKLHVEGRGKSDDDLTTISAAPRQWTTKTERSKSDELMATGEVGTNRCAVEKKVTGHLIHHADPVTFEGDGYVIGKIEDDGPFSGVHYIASSSLKVTREEVVNSKYRPGGEIYDQNIDNDKELTELLAPAADAHEKAHTDLLFGWLASHKGRQEPARRIEKLASPDPAQLAEHANLSLREDDGALCKATRHELVFNVLKMNPAFARGGTIYFGSSQTTVANVWQLGADDVLCSK